MALDPSTLNRLLQLRILLAEAQERSRDRTAVGRHAALILLDGSCEYALRLVAWDRTLTMKARVDFHDTYATVKGALPQWKPQGWAGVNTLHGARNQAQHSGTLADPDEFPSWAADAERFIGSLVAAAFSIDLHDVTLALAVENPRIREHLTAAEDALANGDPEASLHESKQGLQIARRGWDAQRSAGSLLRHLRLPAQSQDFTADYVRKAIGDIADIAEIQPFAPDLGEYLWLRSLRGREFGGPPTTEEEAHRALVFVIGWVMRWEAFSTRYMSPMERSAAWRSQLKAPRTGFDHPLPVIHGVRAHASKAPLHRDGGGGISFEVEIQLADLPEREGGAWLSCFHAVLDEKLKAAGGTLGHLLDRRPDALIRMWGISAEADVTKVAELVRGAISEAQQRYDQHLAEQPVLERKKQEADTRLRPIFERAQLDGQPLFESLQIGGSGDQLSILAALPDDETGHLIHELQQAAIELGLFGMPGRGPLDFHSRSLEVSAAVDPDELERQLNEVIDVVERKRRAQEEAEVEIEQAAEAWTRSLQAALDGTL